ncbi:RluA family pseudouridine synthase [Bacillus marinisedimentorum]|uniref:RluA family pseudouridine synthase n=1 Tax=Bacillus marinisedimentorum TaxID=1821260 RepID=UPI00087211A2|nr:RluA family pseudouridine synthase [Bacillus marinisedimentorum]
MGKCYIIEKTIHRAAEGMLIREFAAKNLSISKTLLTDVKFKGGRILVNGSEENVRYRLKEGDVLTIELPPEERSPSMPAEPIDVPIVYEDDELLVVDKPAGIPTIPSREHPGGTLANAVLAYYDKTGVPGTFHAVNRLDRDTSGLLIIAKNRYVHHLFSLQQRKHLIKRTYTAIAEGRVNPECGVIDAPIGRKGDSIIEREVRTDGQRAVTHYEVDSIHGHLSVLKLKLETGRTHQIRVHLADIGHPLAGDDLYGGSRAGINRQALHSSALVFYHPIEQRMYSFRSGMPEDMRQLLDK